MYMNNIAKSQSIIELEALNAQYSVLLTQYNTAHSDYIHNLTTYNNSNVKRYATIQNKQWTTGTLLSTETVVNAAECKTKCNTAETCSGASYNLTTNHCLLRSGDGTLVNSENNNDYAIIPLIKQNILNLNALNELLLTKIGQINDKIAATNPQTILQRQETVEQQQTLDASYNTLVQQQTEIQNLKKEYDLLTNTYENQSTYVGNLNNIYKIWLVFALTVITIITMYFFGVSPSNSIMFWIMYLCLLIILSFNLSTPQGFLLWGVFLIGGIIYYFVSIV